MVWLPFSRSDVRKAIQRFIPVKYGHSFKIGQTKVTFHDAFHIPGSAMISLTCQGKTLLYTGDFNTIPTRLLRKPKFDLPSIDVLIIESTYAQREHANRQDQEKLLVRIIEDTLAIDGKVIIAGFAVGRIQEVLLVLDAYGINYPVYVDGMAKQVISILNRHKAFLKDPESLERVLKKVKYVKKETTRKKILRNPCVVLTTSGFLAGGAVVSYLKKLYHDRNSTLILAGWQIEGTPGKTLLETGKYVLEDLSLEVRMFVKRLDFSAHVGRSDLFHFVKKLNPERVYCVHGDHTEEFASELRDEGFDATAPVISNRTFVI
jgi:putative mRNA 3-end processing factor